MQLNLVAKKIWENRLGAIWLDFGEIWTKLIKIWAKFKILHPQNIRSLTTMHFCLKGKAHNPNKIFSDKKCFEKQATIYVFAITCKTLKLLSKKIPFIFGVQNINYRRNVSLPKTQYLSILYSCYYANSFEI